jgi:SP family sugar:H+ symporter-like MFS transporter
MGVSFIWVLILGIGIIFFPESPRYDYRHGRIDQAKRTMTKLYGVSDNHRIVAEELAEIKEKHEEEVLHQNQKWWEMFTGRFHQDIDIDLKFLYTFCVPC